MVCLTGEHELLTSDGFMGEHELLTSDGFMREQELLVTDEHDTWIVGAAGTVAMAFLRWALDLRCCSKLKAPPQSLAHSRQVNMMRMSEKNNNRK